MRLLVDAGTVCAEYQDAMFRGLQARRVQVDEMWGFIECKQRNVTAEVAKRNPHAGDVWLWVAVDADSKLVLSHMVGPRNPDMAYAFMNDVASRMAHRIQLTSDGFRFYLDAVENAFGVDVDYAMLFKHYTSEPSGRYSPPRMTHATKELIKGDPNPRHVSPSFVERQNWTVRTTMRRYTRLSNGFSRKLENHTAAVALNYFAYNFIKIRRTLRVSPAMEAGIVSRPFDVSDLVNLLIESESKKAA